MKRDKKVSRTTAKVTLTCGIIVLVVAAIFIYSGVDKRDVISHMHYGKSEAKSVIFTGICFLCAGAALAWEGLYTLHLFDELGVDFSSASALKEYTKNRKKNNYGNTGAYNAGAGSSRTFNTGAGSSRTFNTGAAASNAEYKVIEVCPACGQKIRLPGGKGQLEAYCPRCKYAFYVRT